MGAPIRHSILLRRLKAKAWKQNRYLQTRKLHLCRRHSGPLNSPVDHINTKYRHPNAPPFKSSPEADLLLCFNEELRVLTDIWSRLFFFKLKNYYENPKIIRETREVQRSRESILLTTYFLTFLMESKIPCVHIPLRTCWLREDELLTSY